MSGLDNLRTRLNYAGGSRQQGRMIADKLRSLKKAMFASYQGATAILADGREFRCLINPDKLKNDYDDKIISIPFEDVCLNELKMGKTIQGIQSIGMKAGDIFEWKENNSHWLVYLQRINELAYFRAEIRRCRYEIDINGKKQRAYVKGPIEQTVDWIQKDNFMLNKLNYTLMISLPMSEENEQFFHRFSIIKFKGKNYEVQTIDNISAEGIIDIYLKEYYSNSIEEAAVAEKEAITPEITPPEDGKPHIEGEGQVYPYDKKTFIIKNATGGTWLVDSNKVRILSQNSSKVNIEIITGKSGKFNLIYKIDGQDDISMPITILSL